jgi:peptidoglycan/LPS O-acetylase OafA/YrhL
MDLGVKLFFAISGFVLAIPFLRHYVQGGKKVELKDYFLRRLTRLEPPYLISLIIFAVIHLVMFGMPLPQLIQSFLASLIYSHVFIFAMPNPINPVTWSLETEAQFYLLVPLFFMLLFRHKSSVYRFIFIASIFAFSLFFRWYSYSLELFHWSRSILAFFTHFITGILFAWLYLTKKEFFVQKSYLWDLIGIISLIGIFQFYKPQAYWVNKSLFRNICDWRHVLQYLSFALRIPTPARKIHRKYFYRYGLPAGPPAPTDHCNPGDIHRFQHFLPVV